MWTEKLKGVGLLSFIFCGYAWIYKNRVGGIFEGIALHGLYQAFTGLVTTLVPDRLVYSRSAQLEGFHRARCLTEAVLCPLLGWAAIWPGITKAASSLFSMPGLLLPIFFVLLGLHLAASFVAASELRTYPFSPFLAHGVVHWKPARVSPRALRPVDLTTKLFAGAAILRSVMLVASPSMVSFGSLVSVVFCGLAVQAVCRVRRGTDNEWSWPVREFVSMCCAGLLLKG
ncbi:unnamed protein product [Amoebophrya sp. A25]|nr:unnamed protein product [Amoebophrya sp. A25]|eukprot:GSA25T00018643001.1